MSIFTKKVDLRSRQSMQDFLLGHFRYDGGYAHRIKLHSLDLPNDLEDAAYKALDNPFYWEDLLYSVKEFTRKHSEGYSVCTAGRSSGYLVLHESWSVTLQWKSRCRSCGQLNYQAVELPDKPAPSDPASAAIMQKLGLRIVPTPEPVWRNQCGRCGTVGERGRHNLAKPLTDLRFGKTVNDEEYELDGMDMDGLRNRVKLVQSFDQCVEDMRSDLIYRLKEGLFDPIDEDEEQELEAA
jgi:hypothetical protein